MLGRTATVFRGLVTRLLMLAALVAVAGSGTVKAFADIASTQPTQTITAAADQRQAVVQGLLSADRGTERPCDRNGSEPGLARCSIVQCLTVCGSLPTKFAIPPPPTGADAHVLLTDDPSRGISTIPDLPPPRPSA